VSKSSEFSFHEDMGLSFSLSPNFFPNFLVFSVSVIRVRYFVGRFSRQRSAPLYGPFANNAPGELVTVSSGD